MLGDRTAGKSLLWPDSSPVWGQGLWQLSQSWEAFSVFILNTGIMRKVGTSKVFIQWDKNVQFCPTTANLQSMKCLSLISSSPLLRPQPESQQTDTRTRASIYSVPANLSNEPPSFWIYSLSLPGSNTPGFWPFPLSSRTELSFSSLPNFTLQLVLLVAILDTTHFRFWCAREPTICKAANRASLTPLFPRKNNILQF